MAFQTSMNVQQAPGIPGDFASVNPRHGALSVPGGYVAGPSGVTCGLFAWADTATGTQLANAGSGLPTGFMHRDMQALITTYPSEFGMTIPAGFAASEIFDNGDFWVKNFGTSAVAINMKVFVNNTNGTASCAATGTTVTGSTETAWYAKTMCAAGEVFKMSKTLPG